MFYKLMVFAVFSIALFVASSCSSSNQSTKNRSEGSFQEAGQAGPSSLNIKFRVVSKGSELELLVKDPKGSSMVSGLVLNRKENSVLGAFTDVKLNSQDGISVWSSSSSFSPEFSSSSDKSDIYVSITNKVSD